MNDTICTIDRYEHSPAYGEQVIDGVILWKMPGANLNENSVSGAVKHGDEVRVITTTTYKGELWAKVECTAYPKKQMGWLKSVFLAELGKDQPGIKA